MNKLLITIFVGILIFAAPMYVDGQDLHRSGSTYSSFGLGMPNDYRGPHSGGMNLVGTAIFDDRISSTANPALLGTNRFTNINGGFNITGYSSTDESGTSNSTHIQANQLQISLPIYRDRFGISASLLPETNYNFRVYDSGILEEDQTHAGERLNYESEILGTGGLNRLEVGAGYRLGRLLYVGVAPSFYFGTLERQNDYSIDSEGFDPVNFTRKTSYTGFGGRVGLLNMIPGVVNPNDVLAIGATASMPVSLNAERRVETQRGAEMITIRDSDYYGERTIEYPFDVSFGINYVVNNFRISSDVLYQNWSSYEPFDFNENVDYIDRFRIGLGTQFSGYNPNTPPSFFEDLIYRAGISYDTGNMQINNETVNSWRASVGIGIPTQQRTSSFNINFDYGGRGTQAGGLIEEEIFEIRLSFNLSEFMFFRPRFR